MKKWSPFRSLFLAAVVACVGWLFFSLNGCIGLIWTAFVEEDETVYAAGYSDFRFRLVRKGDTPSQVMLKLGSPLVTIEETTVAVFSRLFSDTTMASCSITNGGKYIRWEYSTTTNDGSYAFREIVFLDEKVVKKNYGYYVD